MSKQPAEPTLEQRVKELREDARKVRKAVEKLQATGLRRPVLLALLKRSSGVAVRDIDRVLDAVETFEADNFTDPE